jgi:hypothetical protein
MKIFITIFLCLALTACPRISPLGIYGYNKSAPQAYKDGWEDGCESGMAAYGNFAMKTLHTFRQDPVRIIKDQSYRKAFDTGFHYCRAYVNRWQASGLWSGEGFNNNDPWIDGGNLRSDQVIAQDGTTSIWQEYAFDLPGWNDNGWNGDPMNSLFDEVRPLDSQAGMTGWAEGFVRD